MVKKKARRRAKRCPGVGQTALAATHAGNKGRCPSCSRIVGIRMPGGTWNGRQPVIVFHSPAKRATPQLRTDGTWLAQFERINADIAALLDLLPDVDNTLQVKSSTVSQVLGSLKALSILLHGQLPTVAKDVGELAARLENETRELNYLRAVPERIGQK